MIIIPRVSRLKGCGHTKGQRRPKWEAKTQAQTNHEGKGARLKSEGHWSPNEQLTSYNWHCFL
jgi:hypothetical protein